MTFPTIISYSNSGYSDFAKIMLFNLNNTIKSHKIHFYCLDQEMFVANKLGSPTNKYYYNI